MNNKMKSYGDLLMEYYNGNKQVIQKIKRDDDKLIEVPVSFYFRSEKDLLVTEKDFIKYVKGDILCIGGGTGTHSLILQENDYSVDTIDISEKACLIMRKRGVRNVKCVDIFEYAKKKYDTILLLGRNIGLVGKLKKLDDFFKHLKKLLNPKGYIILNSYDLTKSKDLKDIKYIKSNKQSKNYYGEVRYRNICEGNLGDYFNWLYLAPDTLKNKSKEHDFYCDIMKKCDDGNYMAVLELKS